ncbi:MAG: TolC family protein [Deltaproteobacteria bacterium]|nr:TolC family protein [Deltaproteobacteria bacterium]
MTIAVLGAAPAVQAASDEAPAPRVLTLRDAVREGLKRNEDIATARERVIRAKIATRKAIAALVPTLTAGGTFTHYNKEIAFTSGGAPIVIQKQDQFGATGTFAMPLFDARTIPYIQKSLRVEEGAAEVASFTGAELAIAIARAYFAVLAAEERLRVAEQAVLTAKEYVTGIEHQVKAGHTIPLALRRVKIDLVRAERDRELADLAVKSAVEALSFLSGVTGPFRVETPPLPRVPAASSDALIATALARRTDVKATRLEIAAARNAIQEIRFGLFPSLSLVGNMKLTESTGFSGDIGSWNLTVNLAWTIFDGGQRYLDVKLRQSELREAELRERRLRRDIGREVRVAQNDLKAAEAALKASRDEKALAEENDAAVRARISAGLATAVEIVDANAALFNAGVAVVREELNRDLARVNLLRAIGADLVETDTEAEPPAKAKEPLKP